MHALQIFNFNGCDKVDLAVAILFSHLFDLTGEEGLEHTCQLLRIFRKLYGIFVTLRLTGVGVFPYGFLYLRNH